MPVQLPFSKNLHSQKEQLADCVLKLSEIAGNLSHNEALAIRRDAEKIDELIKLIRHLTLWNLTADE